MDFYYSAKSTVIFHVYLLWESGHKMTSVSRTRSCLSVTLKYRHVWQMDRLRGGVTLIPIGISKAQNREAGHLETRGGKAKRFIIKD